MEFIECAEYRKACEKASGANLPWEKLKGASVMISGATGMIGSFLTDLIMYQNRNRKQKRGLRLTGKIRFLNFDAVILTVR